MSTDELEAALSLDIDKAMTTTLPEQSRMPKAFTPHMVAKTEPSLSDHVGKHLDISGKLRDQLRAAITSAQSEHATLQADVRTSYARKIDVEVARLEMARDAELRIAVERYHARMGKLSELQQLMNL